MKRTLHCLALLCVIALCASFVSPVLATSEPVIAFTEPETATIDTPVEEEFTDMIKHWARKDVRAIVSKKLMDPATATTFDPDTPVTRATLVVALHRLSGSPEGGLATFEDVSRSDSCYAAVCWAANNSIATGDNKYFRPDDPITREELATILFRFAFYQGYDTTARGDLKAYADANSISDWAKPAMAWALHHKLISGMDATTLAPGGTATRAQLATILNRYLAAAEQFNPAPDAEIIIPEQPTDTR